MWGRPRRLQALVYDSFLQTTAVFSYAIGSRQLSANEKFFCWCSRSSKFVTNTHQTMRVIYNRQQIMVQQISTNKTTIDGLNQSRQNSFFSFSFYPGWMRLMFTCVFWRFYSHFSTRTLSGRVWRKVPESGARSVGSTVAWPTH